MKINSLITENSQSTISFGYQHVLKDLFKSGEMPTVTKGLYGNPINKKNVTLEHLQPHSKGGRTDLSNLALVSKEANNARGNKPLNEFLDKEMLESYLAQFNFSLPGKFNGFQYQEMIRKTCEKQGVGERVKEIVSSSGDSFVKQTPKIDYSSMKSVVENIEFVDLSRLSKNMFKNLVKKGII